MNNRTERARGAIHDERNFRRCFMVQLCAGKRKNICNKSDTLFRCYALVQFLQGPSLKASLAYIRNMCVCVRPHALRNVEPTRWFSQTTADEHRRTPPPCRQPALVTLRTPTEFQPVWRRLMDDLMFYWSCLFELTLCTTRGSDWS